MSGKSALNTMTIALIIVGLVVGAGGGYYITSSQYQPRIEEQETQIEDLGSQIQSLTTRVEILETENTSLVSEITEYENTVSALEDTISDLEAQISFNENTISSLEAQIELLLTEEDPEIPEIIENLENQISELELQIDFYSLILKSYLPETIQIGVTASGTDSLYNVQAVVNITQEEINAYCEEEDFPHRFEFVVLNNRDDVNEAVQNTIWFNGHGINLVVGHERTGECSKALDYVNTHGMMLLSPSASSRSLSISGDNLYRTCPSDLYQAVVIAETLDSMGIEVIIVLQKGDEWSDDVYDALEEEFEARGGVIYERIEFEPDESNFVPLLNRLEPVAEEAIDEYGSSNVAIQVISSDEVSSIIQHTEVFPTLYGLKWFGTSRTANMTDVFESVAEEADQLKLYSPVPVPEKNGRYNAFAKEYREIIGVNPDFYTSAAYDACWLYALTIIEVWTTNADLLKLRLPDIAESYVGASGLCRLNEYGDRNVVDFEIWGYKLEGDQIASAKYGYYDASEWHFEVSLSDD
jgi:branched-chain amino acid transport system substrate-binding protein